MEKKWYLSKGVWLGVCTFLIGAIEIIRGVLETGDFSLLAILTALAGILKVLERVFRSDTTITM